VPLGIDVIRQDFGRKPSFDAYGTMVKQLDGKACVGHVDTWEGVAAYVFAPRGRDPTRENIVLVAWRSDDGTSRLPLKMADADVGMMPIFRTELHRNSDFSMNSTKPLAAPAATTRPAAPQPAPSP
jgi:hypothetical protein